MNALRSLVLVPALLCLGCAAPPVSLVSFRSPAGSQLSFVDDDGQFAGRVLFPGNVKLSQFAAAGDEPTRSFKGTLRVNELVEEERIPKKVRSLLKDGEGGVDIPVKGFYRVFERAESTQESLSVYPVDVSRKQLLQLMDGKEITITAEEAGVLDLNMALDLEVEKSPESE